MKYLLGIDNGGTYAKAAIVSETGRQVAVVRELIPTIHAKPDYAERDMRELWRANSRAISGAISKSGIRPDDIAGISFSGHGKGLYLVNQDGEPTRNGILSTDSRAQDYVKKWSENGTTEKVKEITCQTVLACQPVSLLAWLKDHEPAAYAKASWVFSVNDYIRFRLTGEAGADITAASGCNVINMSTGRYDPEILALFGIDDAFEKLPPLKRPTEVCGTVTRLAEMETGLKAGTPVSAGMFDIDACGIAAGLSDESKMCMIAGTWSINEFISRSPVINQTNSLNSLFCIPGYYLIEESSPTSAGNLEWFVRNLLKSEDGCKPLYDQIDSWVDSVSPEEPVPVFLPFLDGSNVTPPAQASFVGFTSYHTKCHLLRSVYEGVVFSHVMHVRRLLRNHVVPSSISLTGGVTNSPVWVQMFADILQIPVDVIQEKESGAQGAAIAASIAAGIYLNFEEAVRNMVHVSHTVQPRWEMRNVCEKKYESYQRVIDALSPVWPYLK